MSKFLRVTKGLNDKGQLLKPEDIKSFIKDPASDYYTSTYFYDDKQLQEFKQKGGSVKGIKDVKTNLIWWDFDSKENPEFARKDALELVIRLMAKGIKEDSIQVYFSGNKGYNVVLKLNREITPAQVSNIALYKFGKDLQTLDPSLYDSSQLLRIPFTKHQVSGLYKIPLTIDDLKDNTTDQIKEYARDISKITELDYTIVEADDDFYSFEADPEIKVKISNIEQTFDLKTKPRGWRLSKWAIAQGYFEPGERNEAMMILSSTCKAMGFDKLGAYYMCKGALEKHIIRTKREDKFNKEELWNIVGRIYSDNWEGGQYSEDHPLIKKICERLGLPTSSHSSIVDIKEAFKSYKDYAKNIDDITIRSGIEELDKNLRLTVGMSVGILSPPAGGKTSLALQIVNNLNKQGHTALVLSYDMYKDMVIQKLVQNHFDMDGEEIFEKFQSGDEEFEKEVEKVVSKEYSNVAFCFESGQTVDDIRKTIEDTKQQFGKKPTLLIVDYNELVITDVNDPTQASAQVAQKLRQIANEEQMCVISLFQPAKIGSDGPAKEIKSYYDAKGSGAIAQAVSVMLGVSRPGFDPSNPANDKFFKINCLKNRMGRIFSLDLHWDGKRGIVRSLKPNEAYELKAFIEAKENEGKEDDWS